MIFPLSRGAGEGWGEGNLAKAFPHPPCRATSPASGRGEKQDEAPMNASPSTSEHIVKSYDDELKRLTGEIQHMGRPRARATRCRDRRGHGARQQRSDEGRAGRRLRSTCSSRKSATMSCACSRWRQPMARDLREILAALRIAADIERIGDYAANVAKTLDRAESVCAGAARLRAAASRANRRDARARSARRVSRLRRRPRARRVGRATKSSTSSTRAFSASCSRT